MALKVSSKLGRRTRRYMFNKRVNKMIVSELSKNIQEEIDRQIMEQLLALANGIEVESDSTPFMVRETPSSPNFN